MIGADMSEAKTKLSLTMIVRNEARCLTRCLESVRHVLDEIVIVDTGSTDTTVEIAARFNAKLAPFEWIEDFSAARNFALDRASGDWILVLDADEYASPALAREIRDFTRGRPQIGRLKIVSDFRRNNHAFRSQAFVSRLFPRGPRFEGRIHEQLVSPLPRVNLQGELWHDGYLERRKIDRNLKMLLAELERRPHDAYLLYQLASEYASLNRPADAFACLQRARERLQPGDPFAPNVAVDLLYAAIDLKEFEPGLAVIRKAGADLDDFPDFHLARGLFYMHLIRCHPAQYVSQLHEIEDSFRRALAIGETDKYRSVLGSGTFLANYNLGLYYHVFGDAARARACFEAAVQQGYQPAAAMLK